MELPYQLVPPYNHRRNLSERGIQTYKNHFMSGISGAGPDFPLILWDTFVKQEHITINLMHNSRMNPKLSAHAHLFGTFNYDATTIALTGCKCIFHEKPSVRGTWSVHSLNAFYTTPVMQHYRCYVVHATKTLAKRVSDTVTFLPHDIAMPPVVSSESALAKIEDLIKILHNEAKHIPFQEHHDSSLVALHKLSNIFAPTSTSTATAKK